MSVNNSSKRQSNIELLRIISMYMILLLHANFSTFDPPLNNGAISWLRQFAESATLPAVNIFILITGYFGTSFSLKKVKALLFQVLWAVIPISLCLLAFGIYRPTSLSMLIHGFTFWKYWFINAYLGLLVFSPLLNAGIEHLTQRQFKNIVISTFIITSMLGGGLSIEIQALAVYDGYSFIWFIELYLIGRYLKLYPINLSSINLLAIFSIGLLGATLMMRYRNQITYNSTFVTTEAIAIFLLFNKFKLQSKFVNCIAASSTMVYLFHLHPLLFNQYKSIILTLHEAIGTTIFFVISLMSCCIVWFFVAIIYDRLRLWCWQRISNNQKKSVA